MSLKCTVLCADDFAMTEGVTRAIEVLARARRLSATSAMVTTAHWPAHGRRLAALRGDIAAGLHINLTLGRPLGVMPSLTSDGHLPAIGTLIKKALAGRLDKAEIEAEITRQIAAFTAAVGHVPDFVDGHQHAHALPIVREAVVASLVANAAGRGAEPPPLVRNPADSAGAILRRSLSVAKSFVLNGLARGFGALLDRHNLPRNDSFSGVSAFDRNSPYATELARAMRAPGRRHLVMCHPGYPDDELAAIDPVVDRRQDEFDALMTYPELPAVIWHPQRAANGAAIDWNSA